MSTNKVPNWNERQKLLYSEDKKLPAGQLSEIGNFCLQKGYLQDAFEYFRGANDTNALAKLKEISVEEGDAFLYGAIEKVLGETPNTELWNKLGYRAFELGKFRFAKAAFTQTKNELMLAKITAQNDSPTP